VDELRFDGRAVVVSTHDVEFVAGAADRVTLYTGNDDHIVLDLLAPFTVVVGA